MFFNSNRSLGNPPNSGHPNDPNRELLSIYALPLPEPKAHRINQNTRKRKAESLPNPIDNSNIHQEKKTRRNANLPSNPGTFNSPKKNRKQKPFFRHSTSPSQEQLYNKIIESVKSNQIFKSSIPKDEVNDGKSDPEVLDLSHLMKNCSWAKLINSPFVTKMDNEIKSIVDSESVPEFTFKAILDIIIYDLNESVQIEGCTNKWNCFGSSLYGLVSEDSDIDLYYECVNNGSANVPAQLPNNMRKRLQKSRKFHKVVFIKNARVPVLKAVHNETRKEIDISFSNELGVRNSLLTKLYLSLNPNLKYLTLYLKHIFKKYQTAGTHAITTHILVWLVCFFLQQKNLLPPVIDVRKTAIIKQEVAGWDCSLPDVYPYEAKPVSVYSLVLEFFAFYKDFDFLNYIICPSVGRAFLLSDFERQQIPTDEFAVYFKRIPNAEQCTFSRGAMNLQDPSDLSFNLAKQVVIWNVNKFKILCHTFNRLLPDTAFELAQLYSLSLILPHRIDFDNYNPYNLTQYAMFMLQSKNLESVMSKLNHNYMLETIRKVMELVFGMEKKSIVIAENLNQANFSDGKIIKNTASVLYVEYCSSENTWKNEFIKELIPRNQDANEPFRIHLTCEVCLQKNLTRMFVQGEVNFVKFLRDYATQLFSFGLTEIIPA